MKAALRFIGLDLELDTELQELIDLTRAVCRAPIAAITFLDDDYLYLKVHKGTDVTTHAREDTFCTHAIRQDEVMIVRDATKDIRFYNIPAVTGPQKLRFYAGTPLISADGIKIGTLCVLNTKPGNLNKNQQRQLKIIARQAMKTIEFKLRSRLLEENLKHIETQQEFINNASIRLRSFFESSTNFQVLLGRSGEVIDFNKTAFSFVKNAHKTDMKPGDMFVGYVAPEFVTKFINGFNLAVTGVRHVEEGSTNYGKMGIIYWDATFEPAYNADDQIIGISYLIRNITEQKQKEHKIMEQNQSLLNIAHIQAHEFRAPLTTIMGLMGLIREDDYQTSPDYLKYLETAVNNLDEKIRSIVDSIEVNVTAKYYS